MKKFIILIVFTSFLSFGQDIGGVASKLGSYNGISNRGIDISLKSEKVGHPYMFNNWVKGYLVINDSVYSFQKNIQFNQEQGLLILKARNNNEGIIITDKKITGFSIQNEAEKLNRDFIRLNTTAFKNIKDFPETKFFEIITNLEKTNYLLKDSQKYLFDPNKSKGYATYNNLPIEYKIKVTYLIKRKNGKYVQKKLNKKKILEILKDKKSQINRFIKLNKLNLRKEFDVVKLLNYYHNLT